MKNFKTSFKSLQKTFKNYYDYGIAKLWRRDNIQEKFIKAALLK